MPRRPNPVPTYRLHKQSGQAVVTVRTPGGGRKDVLLGRHGTPESKAEYERVLAELRAGPAAAAAAGAPAADPSVAEVLLLFWRHAEAHYRRADGTPTNELSEYKQSLRPVRELYGHTPARLFGPLALKAVRGRMVAAGWCRTLVNRRVGRVRRAFRWAASEELVPAAVPQALATVAGLQKGRSGARETAPVRPVPEADARAVLPHVRPEVAAMIQLQLLTGMRPGEVCAIRPADLDRAGPVWVYRPPAHKMSYRGTPRAVPVGPRARAVLARFEPADPADYYFSPRRAVAALHAARAAARKTPRYPSHLKRNAAKRAARPGRAPAGHYTADGYGHAVARGCGRAGVPPWHPNRLRHTFATAVRARYGLEAAQALLGHERADVTQVYAERNLALAAAVAAEVG